MRKVVYNGIDLMKFVMAIVIVSIHTQLYTPLGRWYLVFQDHAVPLFYVFSSFFFFKKMRSTSGKERLKGLLHFEKRINLLYLFWIVALMPFILYWWHNEYLHLPLADLLRQFVKEYFLGSQFWAAWFFGSLIVAMPIVYCLICVLTKFKSGGVILLLAFFSLYVSMNECEDFPLFALYEENIRSTKMSFTMALWWLTLGFLLTGEKVEHFLKCLGTSKSVLLWVVAFGIGCLFPAFRYLTVIVGTVALFALSCNVRLKGNPVLYGRLRIYSIHLFVMHFSMIFVVGYFLRGHAILVFIITVALCMAISEIMIRLMAYPAFRWLKYSK